MEAEHRSDTDMVYKSIRAKSMGQLTDIQTSISGNGL